MNKILFYRILLYVLEKFHYVCKPQKCIVLVADHMKPRIAKIGFALRNKGLRVVLLINRYTENIHIDFSYFDKVIFFSDEWDLYAKCLFYRPLVYHIFSEASIPKYYEQLIRKRKKLGKVVYDQYDVFRDMARVKNKGNEKREKYCFENADGICCRSFESQYLKNFCKYHFKGKRLLFLDYCWNQYKFSYVKEDQNKALRFVYGGRLLSPNGYDKMASVEFEGVTYLANTITKNGGNFYILPTQSCQKKEFSQFISLANQYSALKIREPMSYEKLIRFESHMDYGIDCLEFESKTNEYEEYFRGIMKYSVKAKYYATNKYFDYLDAGIPALYGRKDEMFGRYLEHFGGAIPCTLEELPSKIDELKKNKYLYKEKAIQAREDLSIEKHINRLIDFYNEI